MRSTLFTVFAAGFFIVALSGARPVLAEEGANPVLVIKDHRFSPVELHVPAGKKVKLIVRNEDPTPEEFESYELNREKVIAGHSEGTVFIGPLEPGTYPFFGEFNPQTAQGKIIVK